MARDHGPQIKDDALYEELLKQGDSKQKAARIANARAKGTLDHRSTHLEDRSKADLMAEARKIGIEGRSRMSKADLEKAIRDHGRARGRAEGEGEAEGQHPCRPCPAPAKPPGMTDPRDETLTLDPRYDAAGLVTAVVTDRAGGELLMVAHMNAEALAATRASGEATFWSRSRGRLWKKGEASGNLLRVAEIRIDCDQDAVWLICDPAGPACHTGRRSCFYRRLGEGDELVPVA